MHLKTHYKNMYVQCAIDGVCRQQHGSCFCFGTTFVFIELNYYEFTDQLCMTMTIELIDMQEQRVRSFLQVLKAV